MNNKYSQQKKEEYNRYELKEAFRYDLGRKVKRKSVDQRLEKLVMINEDNLISVHDRLQKESEKVDTMQKVVGVHLNH